MRLELKRKKIPYTILSLMYFKFKDVKNVVLLHKWCMGRGKKNLSSTKKIYFTKTSGDEDAKDLNTTIIGKKYN